MANALFDRGREGFLAGDIDWDANDIKVALIDATDYDPVVATDEDLADVNGTNGGSASAVEETSGNLASKTTTDGVADAADLSPAFSSASGDVSEELLIYQDTGVDTTSLLIASIDTATGLPVTPNGGDIDITWDSGANKIFKL